MKTMFVATFLLQVLVVCGLGAVAFKSCEVASQYVRECK
jgi:hypothetical protein